MAYRSDNDRSALFEEDHAPITDTESHSIAPLEALDVTVPGRRKLGQPLIDPTPYVWRELSPLARARCGEGNRLHIEISHIAIFWSSHRQLCSAIA
jgi:hypothetical protein